MLSLLVVCLLSQAGHPDAREVERLRLPVEAPPPAPAPLAQPNVFNPTLTVFGDGLYRYDDRAVVANGARLDNHFNLREVEVEMRAAVDPFADGVFILAFPSERPGEFSLEVEEAFVTVKSLPVLVLDQPPLGLKLKLGRFRTEVGRVNRLHLHDLPQVSRPLLIEEFFGKDGFIANGAGAQIFVPTPFDETSALELIAQILTGGGAALADGPARTPGVVATLRWFRTVASAHNLDLALVFHYGRTNPDGNLAAKTYGADFLYKWKPLRGGEFRSFVLGGQILRSDREFEQMVDSDGDGIPDATWQRTGSPFGYFAFAQVQPSRRIYLGVRWDDTRVLDDDRVRRRAASGTLTWYASEFLRFRAGYERRLSDLLEEDGRNSAFAELTFVFGAHQPEPFWVNR